MQPTAPVVHTTAPGSLAGQYLRALAIGRGDLLSAAEFAKAQRWTTAAACLEKAAVAPLDADGAGSVIAPVANDLALALRPLTLLGRMTAVRRVPFRTRLLTHDVGGAGAFVAEGQPIPVSEAGISDFMVLDPRKVSGIRVLTMELARLAVSDAAFAADAAGGVIEALDRALIDPANGGVPDGAPQAITHPDSAVQFESTGATLAAIDADLKRCMDSLTANECSLQSAAWVMHPATATHMATLRGTAGAPAYPGMTARGGVLHGLPVLTSNVVATVGSPGERLIALVEQTELAVADDGVVELDVSSRAAVRLDSAPSAGAQQLGSLWSLGLVGLKATRFCNWRVRRRGAVAVLRSVTY